ncbi:hypothetical protein SEA_FAUST_175 [Streptomyces phage Faust]|uniref:Uncharacterized protein n=1 Tax=Streptomyces phage Faust TaxID=2767565 RepID=A0A7G9UYZ6_9CAUD|nr:hypothetical protein PP456_gp108 [Streptomyces phage Faust]QNN99251.1 hypothetical protein SEA_FAUST_175 [Streptomyces phage Faust]
MTNNREVCENCRKFLVPSEGKWERDDYADYECDGVLTFEPDPFAQEIHDDHTNYWMCDGERYESAMDI